MCVRALVCDWCVCVCVCARARVCDWCVCACDLMCVRLTCVRMCVRVIDVCDGCMCVRACVFDEVCVRVFMCECVGTSMRRDLAVWLKSTGAWATLLLGVRVHNSTCINRLICKASFVCLVAVFVTFHLGCFVFLYCLFDHMLHANVAVM